MAIAYPLAMPTAPGFSSSRFEIVDTVGEARSPFSGKSQFVAFSGSWWEAELSLPPMGRATAAAWQAWLAGLRGKLGTFYAGDPDGKTPRGIATGTPLVDGASQTGNELDTKGWTPSVSGILKAGDYIQVGDELKIIIADADSDGSGNATLTIRPELRVSPSDSSALVVSNARGLFRLSSNIRGWDADHLPIYGINFAIREAI